MFRKYLKLILLILIVGCLCGAQSKECYSCEGVNCLRTSKTTNNVTCIDPVDSCVTVFERSTAIVRGCYSTLSEEHRNKCDNISDSRCHKCYNSLCNDRGAISCLQCNSENNADCQSGVSKIESTHCPFSTSPNTYCYTRKFSNKIERGCLVDINEQLECLADSSCEMCINDGGEDTCNREPADEIISGSKRVTTYSVLLLAVWLILSLL